MAHGEQKDSDATGKTADVPDLEPGSETYEEVIDDIFEEEDDLAESTKSAYRSAWQDFEKWCKAHDKKPVPASPETVAQYLADREHLATSTLKKRRAAIQLVHETLPIVVAGIGAVFNPLMGGAALAAWAAAKAHAHLGSEKSSEKPSLPADPKTIIEDSLRLFGARRRDHPDEKVRVKEPFPEAYGGYVPVEERGARDLTAQQKKLIPLPRIDFATFRDRALLLLGATGKLNRRELTRQRVEDILPDEDALHLVIRDKDDWPKRLLTLRASGDVREDAPRAVAAWIVAAGITEGPIARSFTPQGRLRTKAISTQGLNQMIKRRAEEAELDPEEWSASRLEEE